MNTTAPTRLQRPPRCPSAQYTAPGGERHRLIAGKSGSTSRKKVQGEDR
ncbi:hypothetical protein ABZ079_14170 [Streptomyces sp. NPDC006314]